MKHSLKKKLGVSHSAHFDAVRIVNSWWAGRSATTRFRGARPLRGHPPDPLERTIPSPLTANLSLLPYDGFIHHHSCCHVKLGNIAYYSMGLQPFFNYYLFISVWSSKNVLFFTFEMFQKILTAEECHNINGILLLPFII